MTDPATYQFFLHYAQKAASHKGEASLLYPHTPPPKKSAAERTAIEIPPKTPVAAFPPRGIDPKPAASMTPLRAEAAAEEAKSEASASPSSPKQKEASPASDEKGVEERKSGRGGRFSFKREPLGEVEGENLLQVRSEVEKLFPQLQIVERPPSDELARRIGEEWKRQAQLPEVVILAFHESDDEKFFLQNVARAVTAKLAPCQIYSAPAIEKQGAWERLIAMKQLRLIVASDYGITTLAHAMRHYRESPLKRERTLGDIPLLLLPEISLYLKEPTLKSALWKALKSMVPCEQ